MQQEKYHELIKKLEKESAELTPMLRSRIYPDIIASSDIIVPLLISSVKDTTVKHYLTLMAIAELDQKALVQVPVETRLKIYTDALKKGGPQNDWGLAGRYLSGASLDLVRIGKQAIPSLVPFLDSRSNIGIWGSKEATINENYQNRVCDFAYYVILKILNREEPYFKTPEERDIAIEQLKKFLKNRFESNRPDSNWQQK